MRNVFLIVKRFFTRIQKNYCTVFNGVYSNYQVIKGGVHLFEYIS